MERGTQCLKKHLRHRGIDVLEFQMMKRGRPKGSHSLTPGKQQKIIELLTSGVVMTSIAAQLKIPIGTINGWIRDIPHFSEDVARARDIGYDKIAADCLALADLPIKSTDDYKAADLVAQRKVQIWARLELLKRWDPKRYGDRMQMDITQSIDITATLQEARSRLKSLDSLIINDAPQQITQQHGGGAAGGGVGNASAIELVGPPSDNLQVNSKSIIPQLESGDEDDWGS